MRDRAKIQPDGIRREHLHQLKLPELETGRHRGASIVRRAATAVLLAASITVGALITIAFVAHVDVTVPGTGTLQPDRVWHVRAGTTGTIAEVLVASGDTVQAGSVLARLDAHLIDAAIAQLQAEIGGKRVDAERLARQTPLQRRELQATLARSLAHAARTRALLRQRIAEFGVNVDIDSVVGAVGRGTHAVIEVAAADVAAAEADVDAARAALDAASLAPLDIARQEWDEQQLRARLAQLHAEKQRGTLVSPATGIVLTDELDRLPGMAVQAGQMVLEVASGRGWQATLTVRESGVHRVRPGDLVLIDVPAMKAILDDPLRGRVSVVSGDPLAAPGTGATGQPSPDPMSAAGRYRVEVAIDQSQLDSLHLTELRRGYTVQGKIVTRSVRLIELFRDRLRDRLDAGRE